MNVQQEMQISLTVLITGLVVVFLMLIFLTLVIKGYGNAVHSLQSRYNRKKSRDEGPLLKSEPAQAAEPVPAEPQPLLQSSTTEGIPDEVLAVLAAAASSVIPGGVITSVRRAAVAPDFGRSSWKMAGLLENTRPF
jgi:Na+-transporting methylmalonyl-CoA/oxaloacetate decarboxylase gamma subunit